MSELTTNVLSALAVSLVITTMARVPSQKLKAILYVLPIPITIALVSSNSTATSLSIVGLVLTGLFLWGCFVLHIKYKVHALLADIILAVLYIVVAYVITQSIEVSFWAMLAIYLVLWCLLMIVFKKKSFKYHIKSPTKTNPWLKAMTVFVVAFALFSTHNYLAAFVVTFPYNGVFAVYENRFALLSQAALFTRNSIALTAYFVANYIVGEHHSDWVRYAASWLAFGIVIILVNKYVNIKIKGVKATGDYSF